MPTTTPAAWLEIMAASNGVAPAHWWAKGKGAAMEFGPAAQPLTAIREDIVFVSGLYNHLAFINTSPHMGRMAKSAGACPSARSTILLAWERRPYWPMAK